MIAGFMLWDAPGSEKNPYINAFSILSLTFPFISFICGVLSLILRYWNINYVWIDILPLIDLAIIILIIVFGIEKK